MSIVTILFLANLISLIATVWIDQGVLKGRIEKLPGFGPFLEVWTLITIFSVPVWLVYLLFTV